MTTSTWTPVFSDGDESNLAGAVYQALGAASLCWEDMSGTGRFQSEEATRIAEGLLAFIAEQQADLIDALEDVVNQACSASDDYEGGSHLDSMALSAYAHGMRTLAKLGRIEVESEYGRRVIGRWKRDE